MILNCCVPSGFTPRSAGNTSSNFGGCRSLRGFGFHTDRV